MRLPSVLIPYPLAADDHQWHNARAFVDTGAALLLGQQGATGGQLASLILNLVHAQATRSGMTQALERWHRSHAAELIAERILALMQAMRGKPWNRPTISDPLAGRSSHAVTQDGSSDLRASQRTA